MAEPMLWIGGWASNLACWRRSIEARFPGRRHRFLDAHSALADEGVLPSAAAGMPPGGIILAWSLGSLLLHRALATGTFPRVRTVSLSPIFDFCGEGSPWPPAVLARMLRKLARSREEVLSEFWTMIKGNSPVTHEEEEAWRAQSREYSFDSLAAGLEALGSIRIDPASLPRRSDAAGRHILLASDADPLAPAAVQLAGLPGEMQAGLAGYPGGHLPFLDYPEAVLSALAGNRDAEGERGPAS